MTGRHPVREPKLGRGLAPSAATSSSSSGAQQLQHNSGSAATLHRALHLPPSPGAGTADGRCPCAAPAHPRPCCPLTLAALQRRSEPGFVCRQPGGVPQRAQRTLWVCQISDAVHITQQRGTPCVGGAVAQRALPPQLHGWQEGGAPTAGGAQQAGAVAAGGGFGEASAAIAGERGLAAAQGSGADTEQAQQRSAAHCSTAKRSALTILGRPGPSPARPCSA